MVVKVLQKFRKKEVLLIYQTPREQYSKTVSQVGFEGSLVLKIGQNLCCSCLQNNHTVLDLCVQLTGEYEEVMHIRLTDSQCCLDVGFLWRC